MLYQILFVLHIQDTSSLNFVIKYTKRIIEIESVLNVLINSRSSLVNAEKYFGESFSFVFKRTILYLIENGCLRCSGV